MVQLTRLAQGDARRALTVLEAAAVQGRHGPRVEDVDLASDRATVRYDKDGDQHYDVISAFIKSIRGSDVERCPALARPDAGGGRGPAVRRAPADGPRVRGRRARRPDRAARGDGGRGGSPEGRDARVPDSRWRRRPIHLCLSPKSERGGRRRSARRWTDVTAGADGPRTRAISVTPITEGAQKLGHGQGYIYPHDVEGRGSGTDSTCRKRPVSVVATTEPTHYGQERRAGRPARRSCVPHWVAVRHRTRRSPDV